MAAFTEFPLNATKGAGPANMCFGLDGNLWCCAETGNYIVRLVPRCGNLTYYPIPTGSAGLGGINPGSDGNIWFVESTANKIGRINTYTQAVTEFAILPGGETAGGIFPGSDGNLWVMGTVLDQVYKVSTAGALLATYALTSGTFPHGPCLGPDGNIWFCGFNGNTICNITPSGVSTQYALPNASSQPTVCVNGGDGNIYFAEQANPGRIGQSTTTGTITEFTTGLTINSTPFGCGLGVSTGQTPGIWICERGGNRIAVMPVGGGTITEHTIPTGSSNPDKIIPGLGAGGTSGMWFSENNVAKLGFYG